MQQLINNPQQWRQNFPTLGGGRGLVASGMGGMGGMGTHSVHSHYSLSAPSFPSFSPLASASALLPGGGSVAWTREGGSRAEGGGAGTGAGTGSYTSQPQYGGGGGGGVGTTVDVLHILRHGGLSAVKSLPLFSQEELIAAMQAHPRFLHLFIQQVRALRVSAAPYIFLGSRSIEDSIQRGLRGV
ncbi:hypothetical protein B484DRAFT_459011 [Ochromonadaceae sp. CCMP2298]|nr:hypothetical protein B484DRAFT_459011 [Ochromonadaceae sp. CCMP2298]